MLSPAALDLLASFPASDRDIVAIIAEDRVAAARECGETGEIWDGAAIALNAHFLDDDLRATYARIYGREWEDLPAMAPALPDAPAPRARGSARFERLSSEADTLVRWSLS